MILEGYQVRWDETEPDRLEVAGSGAAGHTVSAWPPSPIMTGVALDRVKTRPIPFYHGVFTDRRDRLGNRGLRPLGGLLLASPLCSVPLVYPRRVSYPFPAIECIEHRTHVIVKRLREKKLTKSFKFPIVLERDRASLAGRLPFYVLVGGNPGPLPNGLTGVFTGGMYDDTGS
jgi:hypothetical protein